MNITDLGHETFQFYRRCLQTLQAARIPFVVGGAYAFANYTGIVRHTKDLDLFLQKRHVRAALEVLSAAGYRAEMYFSHWLAKGYHGDDFVDVIFSSGNGLCAIDQECFDHAVPGIVLGIATQLMPAEEMIWQKAFIMERERFDGADVNHLFRARGQALDWQRLLARFGAHWRVLLSHLLLFGFVYPHERDVIPTGVLTDLLDRLRADQEPTGAKVCQGLLLSRTQYITDVEQWGYADPRVPPLGTMTVEQAERWTDAGR